MLTVNILTIRDETAMGQVMYEFDLTFPKVQITVKDIIIERVKQEVDNYNNKQTKEHYGLVQPTQAEKTLNRFKLDSKAKINVETQIDIALRAFESNGFFVLINNVQVEALTEQITIDENQTASFIKLVPLVGG